MKWAQQKQLVGILPFMERFGNCFSARFVLKYLDKFESYG